jgi:uncharacterized membrane protein
MDFFKNINLSDEQKQHLIVWLSGVYGLFLGIISMFFIELRLGISSWLQLTFILVVVAGFVLMCNAVVKWILYRKKGKTDITAHFWLTIVGGLILLLLTALVLGYII